MQQFLAVKRKGRDCFFFNCQKSNQTGFLFQGGGWDTIIRSGWLRAQAAKDRHGLCGGPQPEHARQIHGGAPGGGRAPLAQMAERSEDQGAQALGQVDIMSVMSSEEREGFWQAGCAPSMQPACQKATADKRAYQPCRSAATFLSAERPACPKPP